MIKIVLINHSFQAKYYARRWQLFAKTYPDVDVTLLTPSKFKWYNNKQYTYTGGKEMEGENFDDGNYHVRVFRLKYKHSWVSDDFKSLLTEIQPDVIYHLGTHTQLSLIQLGQIRKEYLPESKLILFSMRGPAYNIRFPKKDGTLKQWMADIYLNLYRIPVVKYINRNYDAVFCHYPDAVECFRKEGYKGPIYMQTQVGVNTEWFHEDDEYRKEIREKYNLGKSYVFGSATRFTPDKGVDDILKALPKDGDYKYLMMGTGSEADLERLKGIIRKRGIDDKVIITGFVDWYDMAKYWNAVDCAIHVPLTTPHWVETFSLSVIQAMISGKPIIGSNSGSVPYQIGPEGMIVEEGNVEELRCRIEWVLTHRDEAHHIGERMKNRVEAGFTVKHLNELFYRTITEDILKDKYDDVKHDMVTCMLP